MEKYSALSLPGHHTSVPSSPNLPIPLYPCTFLLLAIILLTTPSFAQTDITVSDPVFGKAEVSATNSVTLAPGFHAKEGCDFRAYIGTPQGTTNSYTQPPEQTVSGSPTIGKNYIRTITLREPEISVPTSGTYDHTENIQYFDGLGRPIQTIDVNASPGGNDIIQPIVYDAFGRQEKQYLPYISNGNGEYRSSAHTAALAYYKNTPPTGKAADDSAYIRTEFDNSPLNRVMKQFGPGEAWFAGSKKPVGYNYTANTSTVINWSVDNSDTYSYTRHDYLALSLYITETTDEEGNTTREYKDKQGRVVQKESELGGQWLRTLYIYDDLGQLRCVVPPKASSPETDTELCYYYTYDERGRMIVKDIPGAGPVYMVYDKRDRLALTQDERTREKEGANVWYFTKYDKFNRPVMTGKLTLATAKIHSDICSDFMILTYDLYETYDGSSCFGYTANNSYPLGYKTVTSGDVLTVTYYDNYDFKNFLNGLDPNRGDNLDYSEYNETGFLSSASNKTKGLVTGGLIDAPYVPGSAYIGLFERFYAMYYDDYGNVIRHISENQKDRKDIISTKYKPITFEVEKTLQVHTTGLIDDLKIKKEFAYDHTGRLLETTLQVNFQDPIVLNAMEYNELGELVTKYLHSKDQGPSKNFLQKTDFTYTIRGWLKTINSPDLGDDNDVFGMELFYENISGMNSLPPKGLFNGNIAGMKWGIKNDLTRGYGFGYDGLNRLTAANYADGSSLNQHVGYNSVQITKYDKNGNIVELSRKFNNTMVDNLTYTYGNTNQLQSVNDAGTTTTDVDDYPSGTSETYTYDDNGNMKHDGGKVLNITYNYLNLPMIVDFGGGNKLFYHYDAMGNKLVKYKSPASGPGEATHYFGNIVFNGDEIAYILTEEGRIIPYGEDIEGPYAYEYSLKDHLGNTRAVISGADLGGTVDMIQHSNYYPFGLAFNVKDYNTSTNTEYAINKYLYNNKEIQNDMFAGTDTKLNWYDYGQRMYDPQLGRFHVVDPKAETYIFQSPYVYAADNPVFFVDKDGEGPIAWLANFMGWTSKEDATAFIQNNNIGSSTVQNSIYFAAGWANASVGADPVNMCMGSYQMLYNYWKNNIKMVNKAIQSGVSKEEAIQQVFSLYINAYEGAKEMISSAYDDDWYARGQITFEVIAAIAAGKAAKSASATEVGANATKASNALVEYGGRKVPAYRGGNSFKLKPGEFKINPETGFVKTTHGVSIDISANTVGKFGGAYKIESLPKGLKIIQRGQRLEHFEIVPAYEMSIEKFQSLLDQIKVVKVN